MSIDSVAPRQATLVERVADAVLSDLTDRRGIRQAFDNIEPDTFEEIRQAIGRAALEAMRDPSDDLAHTAGLEWAFGSPTSVGSANERREMGARIFNRVIDAALAESSR